jgi:protein involved in polysaccharide export with SLBB domain
LQRTGLDPYRIDSPDVLTIYLPALQVTCSEMQQELTARGVLTIAQLPFVGKKAQQLVGPDGTVTIGDIGTVYVAGMTTEEAETAIRKKACEAHPQASRAAFGVFVDVSAKNSKKAYVVLQGGACGDNVSAVPATAETTVTSALQKCGFPRPIDFASAKIWIARPGNNGGRETVLPVNWNSETGQPTCDTNHAVLPGDRLFVQASAETAIPVPPLPVAEFPVMPHPVRYYAPTPVAPYPYPPIAIDAPANPPVMRYSAIPAAAPSPFSLQPSVIQASPVFAALPPLPQPPEPSTQPPCAGTCANSNTDSWAREGKNVEFTIAVIEDVSGSFAEFPKLREGLIMVSDSGPTLAAVRIMENQKLVKRISAPQIRCVVGEQATFCLTSACECQKAAGNTESLSVQVKAQDAGQSNDGSHIFVETGVQATRGQQIRQVKLAYRIEEGQTAILKTGHQPRPGSTDGERAVYVVVTPKVVK